MKKAVVLGVSIAAGIILIALAVWFTIPRAVFYNSVKGMTEGCSIATYCEKYDVRFDSAVRADLITYTAEFPDSYVREEIKTDDIQCISYTEGDSKVLIIPNDEPIDGNLLNPDLYTDDDLLGNIWHFLGGSILIHKIYCKNKDAVEQYWNNQSHYAAPLHKHTDQRLDKLCQKITENTNYKKKDHVKKHTAFTYRILREIIIEIKLPLLVIIPVLIPLIGNNVLKFITHREIIFI